MQVCHRTTKAQGSPPLGFVVLAFLALLLAFPSQSFAQAENDDVLREKVKTAIQRGQKYLLSRQNGNGSFETGYEGGYTVGSNSLVGLALITSGMDPKEVAIQRCLRYIRLEQLPKQTYDLGMAILFLSAAGESKDVARIQHMAETLIDQQAPSGGWGYGTGGGDGWDNSNTQFAILGLREASFQTGMVIDQKVWKKSRDHWLKCQSGSAQAAQGAGWGSAAA